MFDKLANWLFGKNQSTKICKHVSFRINGDKYDVESSRHIEVIEHTDCRVIVKSSSKMRIKKNNNLISITSGGQSTITLGNNNFSLSSRGGISQRLSNRYRVLSTYSSPFNSSNRRSDSSDPLADKLIMHSLAVNHSTASLAPARSKSHQDSYSCDIYSSSSDSGSGGCD
ncbi:hypothetical protein KKJ09_12595 [Xenorhabdus bovienii]|uniref:hypothetical protein n=1 Tax=Xenorhabdus bovienii TaxID=40576 RepID=UPI0023B2E8B2|nr:hypothetical protein [Xenorhabdus bovienii]MDE9494401.1 hypothetical protein [Xenorhabdus bovienii]MDE9502840.1 hypothetical protein [Xenorhabdus bovienii]MDE9526455.1 hypothetical protein [Xenorhabdus bovienii]